MNLELFMQWIDDPSSVRLFHNEHEITFIDDYGLSCGANGSFFLVGHEFGATTLVHARSYEDAWEAWLDEQQTIPEEELIEALRPEEGGDSFEDLARKKLADERPSNVWSGEYDDWATKMRAEAKRMLKECESAVTVQGYEYQANCSGTGIVNVGHYVWCNRLKDLSEFTLQPKEAPKG